MLQRQEAPGSGASSEPLPLASMAQRQETSEVCASPELPSPAPSIPQRQETPVASSSPEPVTVPLPATSSVQQQQQPRVPTAVTRSASRQQGGMGQRRVFVSMLATQEDIDMDIASQSPPYTPPLDLP